MNLPEISTRTSGHRGALAALGLVALASLAVSPLPAAAADAAAAPQAISGLPACDDAGVLSTIRDRFAYAATRVEKRTLALDEITAITELKTSVVSPSPIARRWCTAAVALSDKTTSTLTYRIERGTGFAAHGYFDLPSGVEFCVAGHDPWHAHGASCRTTLGY